MKAMFKNRKRKLLQLKKWTPTKLKEMIRKPLVQRVFKS